MKKITLAMLLMASLNAQAGDYTNAYLKVDTCHELGAFAAQFYTMRAKGEPKYTPPDDGSHVALIFRYAADYAWGDAIDAQDAKGMVTAKCMDNYDWAVQSDKMEMARPDKLHY